MGKQLIKTVLQELGQEKSNSKNYRMVQVLGGLDTGFAYILIMTGSDEATEFVKINTVPDKTAVGYSTMGCQGCHGEQPLAETDRIMKDIDFL